MRRALIDGIVAAALSAAAVLAGSCAGDASAQTVVGINTVTAHTGGGHRWDTPGIFARNSGGVTAGILRNSSSGSIKSDCRSAQASNWLERGEVAR